MDRILRFAAAGALGLAFAAAAPAAKADSHSGVTVGGWIEVIGGTTDNDKAGSVDGISRGLFSRFAVSYDNTLDNGLTVSGRAAYQFNQRGSGANVSADARMDAATNYAPDVLYISVGGGFGTVTVGAAAPASCSTLPRPIAFVNGVNSTHYTLFTGLGPINGTFSEYGYCGTPEQVSYMTPTVGGFKAMLTYAPDDASNQGTALKRARTAQSGANVKDRIDIAASWSSSMGAANVSVGVGYQQGSYQDHTSGLPLPEHYRLSDANEATTATGGENEGLDTENGIGHSLTRKDMRSLSIAGTVGIGGMTFGAAWYDTEESESGIGKHDGYSLAAKYAIGNLSLGATWSTAERGTISTVTVGANEEFTLPEAYTQKDTALVVGASYAVGGGLTAWIEYVNLETDYQGVIRTMSDGRDVPESDDIILVGVTLGF